MERYITVVRNFVDALDGPVVQVILWKAGHLVQYLAGVITFFLWIKIHINTFSANIVYIEDKKIV
jgi:hypothetical protein